VRVSWGLGGCRDFRCRENGHLSDDKTVAKMGHPVLVARLDVGHRSYEGAPTQTEQLARLKSFGHGDARFIASC